MGELLRAVCDKTCIDSNPAFYTIRQGFLVVGPSAANTFAERSQIIECKRDTWFLMMGWAQSSLFDINLTQASWATRSAATSFSVRDVKTGRRFNSLDTVQKVDQNFNLNNFVTLPEYVLWEPGAAIEVIQNVQVTAVNPVTFNSQNLVVLAGIEYKLPDRPGGYLSGKAA